MDFIEHSCCKVEVWGAWETRTNVARADDDDEAHDGFKCTQMNSQHMLLSPRFTEVNSIGYKLWLFTYTILQIYILLFMSTQSIKLESQMYRVYYGY